jgi:predicted Zn-dependent peptidase
MNYANYFKKFTILVLLLFQFTLNGFAQTTKLPEPRQEKLLNGLKILIWNEPRAEKVTVKLRVHSGSAFDPQGKEGVMALLADALFPNDAQKEFFTEDLGGSLEVKSNFDYLQINATGNSDQFLTVMETLATAVTNPQINKEINSKVVSARLEKVKVLEKNPAYIADQAVSKRLFGDFPYGRAQKGTSASLAKIDFADLLFARQRFLTADNATLVIIGNVKPDIAFRAARRYFGAWEKADKKVPATFRQPDAPDTEPLRIEVENSEENNARFAVRGLARNDKDYIAFEVYGAVFFNKIHDVNLGIAEKVLPNVRGSWLPNLLLGRLDLSTSGKGEAAKRISELKTGDLQKIFSVPITEVEFTRHKASLIRGLNDRINSTERIADWWLNNDTYKLPSIAEQIRAYDSVSFEDVQRVALRFQKEPIVSVFVIGKTNDQKTGNQ